MSFVSTLEGLQVKGQWQWSSAVAQACHLLIVAIAWPLMAAELLVLGIFAIAALILYYILSRIVGQTLARWLVIPQGGGLLVLPFAALHIGLASVLLATSQVWFRFAPLRPVLILVGIPAAIVNGLITPHFLIKEVRRDFLSAWSTWPDSSLSNEEQGLTLRREFALFYGFIDEAAVKDEALEETRIVLRDHEADTTGVADRLQIAREEAQARLHANWLSSRVWRSGKGSEAVWNLPDSEAVATALNGDDWDSRAIAKLALEERVKDSYGEQSMIAGLRHEDEAIRKMAIGALRRMDDRRAIDALIAALQDAKDSKAVEAAVAKAARTKELDELRIQQGIQPIVAILNSDSDWEKRSNAATSLGNSGDRNAVDPLIAALEDESTEVRGAAIRALGDLKDSRAVEPLLAIARHDRKWVRRLALDAISSIKESQS